MAHPIFTQLNPNFDLSDSRLASRLLVKTLLGKVDQKAIPEVETWFARKFGGEAVLFNSGRAAELAIFKVLAIPESREAIVQPFTCVAAINPVWWAGLKPVFTDIEEDTLCLDSRRIAENINTATKAILVQHTFGNVPDYKKILPIARKCGIPVIQDCAHTLEAKLVGTAAFFSLGSGKVVSGVSGGVVVTKDKHLAKKLARLRDGGKKPPKLWQSRQLLYPLLMPLVEKMYQYNFTTGKVGHKIVRPLFAKPVEKLEKQGRAPSWLTLAPSPVLAELALKQLEQYPKQLAREQALLAEYQKRFQGSGSLIYNILRRNAKAVIAEAKKQRIFLGNWYSNVIDPKGVDLEAVGYKKGSCPVAEKVATQSINLPVNKKISLEDVKIVVEELLLCKEPK
ncbi:MAG: DegT/DnrJ/EryC1/StrS family aminotransferase [bacterium]